MVDHPKQQLLSQSGRVMDTRCVIDVARSWRLFMSVDFYSEIKLNECTYIWLMNINDRESGG